MPSTKRGIYHNLKESQYAVSNGEVVLFFSSRLYLRKFVEGFKQNRENVLGKIPVKMLNMEILADIAFYIDTEKRGFHAWLKGVTISCEDLHRYALRKMIEKNTPDWLETQRPKFEERIRTME